MDSDYRNFNFAAIKCQFCILKDKICDKRLPNCGDCVKTQHKCIYEYQKKSIKKESKVSKIALIQRHKIFIKSILERIVKINNEVFKMHEIFKDQLISTCNKSILEHFLAMLRMKRKHLSYFYRFDGSALLVIIVLLNNLNIFLQTESIDAKLTNK